MKHTSKLTLVVLTVLLASCAQSGAVSQDNNVSITGSGNIVSREMALSGFDRVEAGLYFNITIRHGEGFGVVVHSDDNFIEYIQVEKRGTTLSFDLNPDYAYNFYGVTMRAEVTMPELNGLVLNGSSHATLADFVSVNNLEVELTGSSSLSGEVEVDTVSLNVYGSAYAELTGSARTLRIDSCGNSLIDLGDFRAKDATVHASCASTAVVRVDGRLAGDASQNARVYYVGQPASRSIISHESATVDLQQ